MMFYRCSLCLLVFALSLAAACDPAAREANIDQDKYIENYIQKNYPDNEIYRDGGVCRIILTAGASGAPVVEEGDSVYFYYAGFVFSSSGPSSQFTLDSTMVRVGSGDLIRGLEKGLAGARLGEESLIVFSADDGYGSKAVGMVPENSALLFDVAIAEIKKN